MPLQLTRPLLLLLAMCLAVPAQANTLIDQVPDDAALYVGWRGADNMGPSYEGSNMQGIVEQTGLLKAVPYMIDAIQQMTRDEEVDPEVTKLIGMGGTLWGHMWSSGGAMYMLPPEEGKQGPPIPRFAVLWNKGKGDKALADALLDLSDLAGEESPVPIFVGEAGDAMFLSIGFDLREVKVKSLKGSDNYKKAVAQVQGDGALVVYIDIKQWIGQIDAFAKMMKQQAQEFDERDPFAEIWFKVRDASGLSGVNRLAMSAGIKDKNWHTRLYLEAPKPRVGVLSLLDNEPVKGTDLLHVPKTATYLQVLNLDSGKVLDVTRQIMKAVDPEVAKSMDKGMAEASKEIGVDLEKDLIKGLGAKWSVYIDPMIAGNGFSSIVLVNACKDADAVNKALTKLSEVANKAMDVGPGGPPIKVRLLTEQYKGVKITHLGIPYLAPSWMIHKGKLYMSLYPQALEMAVDQSGKADDSILANPTFKKTVAQFGVDSYTGVSFTDLPETAADGYGSNLALMQIIAGMGEMFSGKAAPLRMPPVGKIMPFVEPAGGLTWMDGDGMHMHTIEPFPGSSLLGPAKGLESSMAVTGPLAVAILLPALGSAREAAVEAQGMSQVRQIGVATFAYAADNKDQMPQDIAALYEYVGDIEPFVSPRSLRAKPLGDGNLNDDELAAYLRKNSSYVLIPLGKMDDIENGSDTVLAFQRPDDTPNGSIGVVYADGHAEQIDDLDDFRKTIKAQTGKTVKELIKRQEDFKP